MLKDATRLVFVGGSHDGKRYVVSDFLHTVEQFPLRDEGVDHLGKERYNREKLAGKSKTFDVMVVEGMEPDVFIKTLIDNYGPERSLL